MQPGAFNEQTLGWNGILAPEYIGETSIWLPRQIARRKRQEKTDIDGYKYNKQWPLAIYPKKANHRITGQQGTFTVHGRDTRSLDQIYAHLGGSISDAFARIELRGLDEDRASSELALLGTRRSAIYPDIDNLVRHLKEAYKW